MNFLYSFFKFYYICAIAEILLAKLDQPLADLYVSTLAVGTYIFVMYVSSIAKTPSVGGVVALMVILSRLLQLEKAELPILVKLLGRKKYQYKYSLYTEIDL